MALPVDGQGGGCRRTVRACPGFPLPDCRGDGHAWRARSGRACADDHWWMPMGGAACALSRRGVHLAAGGARAGHRHGSSAASPALRRWGCRV